MNNTSLKEFCIFLEETLCIRMPEEKWKAYYEQKDAALANERNQMIDAFNAGIYLKNPDLAKTYVENSFGKI